MKEYNISQEDLNITIKYTDKDDLIDKLDSIICDLISFGYGTYANGTDGILKEIKNNNFYEEDLIITNENYDNNINI